MAAQLTITSKQEKAIAALLSEATITTAATKIGVTEGTLHKWLKDPAFVEAYRAARRDAVAQAVARLQQVSSAAVAVLVQVMADRGTMASVRVAAASKILDYAIKAVELEDIAARLDALEQLNAREH